MADKRVGQTVVGTLKWFSEEKGFGFIVPDEGGKDIFVHHSEMQGDGFKGLSHGARVTFDLEDSPRGLVAREVAKEPANENSPEEYVFLLGDDGQFRYLPCISGPAGNILIEDGGLASIFTDASLPDPRHVRARQWKACAEFERLINEPLISESTLQQFFEEHPEFLLGDQYEALYPQIVLPGDPQGTQLRPDFILRPFAGMSHEPEIVELKLPQQPIVKLKKSSHIGLYAPVHEAVNQLRSYARVFEEEGKRDAIATELGFTAHRPTLALVVGRIDRLPSNRITALAKENIVPVRLHTYDDLLLRYRRRAGLD